MIGKRNGTFKNFKEGAQEDAQEFMLVLLDLLYNRACPPPLIFDGLMNQNIQCDYGNSSEIDKITFRVSSFII